MKKLIYFAVILFFFNSCAPNPKIVEINQPKDISLDCKQLRSEIISTQIHKKAARSEDKFKLRYIFPPTAFTAIYRFNKAETNAEKRIENLREIATKKGCHIYKDRKYINPQLIDNYQYRDYK